MSDSMQVVTVDTRAPGLGQNHVEYWKTIRRGGDGLEGHTIGFEWFAPWPAVKRFRWYNPATWWPYLTTRGPSPLGWTATSAQCRRELTEESAAIRSARERVSYNPVGVQIIEHRWRVLTTMPNKRQGWTPDGQSLEAGA